MKININWQEPIEFYKIMKWREKKNGTSKKIKYYFLFLVTFILLFILNHLRKYHQIGSIKNVEVLFLYYNLIISLLGAIVFFNFKRYVLFLGTPTIHFQKKKILKKSFPDKKFYYKKIDSYYFSYIFERQIIAGLLVLNMINNKKIEIGFPNDAKLIMKIKKFMTEYGIPLSEEDNKEWSGKLEPPIKGSIK